MEKVIEEFWVEVIEKGEDLFKVFLIEGDIFIVWMMKLVVGFQDMDFNRIVVGFIVMLFCKVFEGDLIFEVFKSFYVGNVFGWGNVFVIVGDVNIKFFSWFVR